LKKKVIEVEKSEIITLTIVVALITSIVACYSIFSISQEELKGEKGDQGPPGKGVQGPPGMCEIPTYEWQGTSIRFQNPDGSWGEWVDLQGERGIGEIPTHEWQDTSIRFQNPDGSWREWVDLQGERGESVVGPEGPQGPPGAQGESYAIGNTWQSVRKWDLNALKGKPAQRFETYSDFAIVRWSFSSSYKTPELIITIYKCTENGDFIYPAYAVIKGSASERSGEYWLVFAGNWAISINVQRVRRLEIEVLELAEW